MDNEGKITNTENTRDFFLRKDLRDIHKQRQLYDLDKEFVQTKKNKKWWIPLTILGIIAGLFLVSYLVTITVQKRSKNYELDLDTFQDVDLSEILDEVKKLESQLQAAERGLANLLAEKNLKIQDVEDWAEREVRLLDTMRLSNAAYNRRVREIEEERDAQIQAINEEYAEREEEQRATIALIEDRWQRYDSRQVEMARQQEELLNQQEKLNELEKDAIREEYEDKIQLLKESYEERIADLNEYLEQFDTNLKDLYDPVFTGEEIQALLAAPVDEDRRRENLPLFSPVDYPLELMTPEDLEELDLQLRETRALINQVYSVPFENSIADSLIQIDYRVLALVDTMKEDMDRMNQYNQMQMGFLEEWADATGYSMDLFIKEAGCQGIIIDPRNSESIIVYIDPVLSYEDGTTGYVFRLDEQLVAQIEVYNDQGLDKARVVRSTQGFRIQPYDRIILNLDANP